MSKSFTVRTSKRMGVLKTHWPRIRAMRETDIDLSDIPEVTAEMAAHGTVRRRLSRQQRYRNYVRRKHRR